ncbi:DgyrCDS14549 [Dimorphilus gyrociliatus]|uniref:DgyrCDS14549 n=1 Tax=Dimorphilus gyrociliatus TaxID=2664684 RepID=A0A7I8WDY7_9ANNE|nr:DgyrCDS14549 [Dimorphilus gyrociliatus]
MAFDRQPVTIKVLLFIGLPVNIALSGMAIGLNSWFKFESTNQGTIEIGLFKICNTVNKSMRCESIDSSNFKYSSDDWFRATKSLFIGSAVSIVIAWFSCIISQLTKSLSYPLNKQIIGWFSILCSLASIIAWALFLSNIIGEDGQFHVAFYMACMTSALAILNAIFSFRAFHQEDDDDESIVTNSDDYSVDYNEENRNMRNHYPKGYDYRALSDEYISNRNYPNQLNINPSNFHQIYQHQKEALQLHPHHQYDNYHSQQKQQQQQQQQYHLQNQEQYPVFRLFRY